MQYWELRRVVQYGVGAIKSVRFDSSFAVVLCSGLAQCLCLCAVLLFKTANSKEMVQILPIT